MEGIEHLDKVIAIDQSPIGRTPRSNPATYTGLFNDKEVHFDFQQPVPGARLAPSAPDVEGEPAIFSLCGGRRKTTCGTST